MMLRLGLGVLLLGGLGFLSLVVVVFSAVSLKIAAVLVPGLAIGAFLALNPFVGLVLLVLFAQLDAVANIVSQSLPISFYKLLTVATLGGYGLMSYRMAAEDRLGQRSMVIKLALLFALAMGMSMLLADYKAAALGHMIGFLSVMLLLFLIPALTDRPWKLEALAWTLVASGGISGLVVLIDTFLGIRLLSTADAAATAQFEGQARSAGASDFNPTTASHMLLATTVIAGVMFVYHPRWRLLSGGALLVGVPALVLTFARSAAIAFAVVALIFAWQNRGHRLFPFIVLCGIAAAAAAIPFVPELYWERLGTMINIEADRTLLRRISYNLIGLDLLAQRPLLGVGPGNFPLHYAGDEYRWFPGREPLPRQLHNSYLEVATEMGLIGLTLFVGVMVAALRQGISAVTAAVAPVSPLARAFVYGFAAFLVASIFMPNEDTKFMWILPGLCLAAAQLATAGSHAQRGN